MMTMMMMRRFVERVLNSPQTCQSNRLDLRCRANARGESVAVRREASRLFQMCGGATRNSNDQNTQNPDYLQRSFRHSSFSLFLGPASCFALLCYCNSNSPLPSSIISTHSVDPPFSLPTPPSLFHSQLQTYLFHKSFQPLTLLPYK